MEIKALLGIFAGLLSFFAYLLYIYSSIWGKTRPNRVTWGVLTLVGIMIASSYYAGGARNTIWIALAYIAGPFVTFLISLKHGEGGTSRFDLFCLAGVVASLVLWFSTGSAMIALLINILIDALGFLPTVKKSYLRPKGEDRKAWLLESIASALNLTAIERWTFAIWIYPIYLLVVNSLITLLLFQKRKRRVNLLL